MCNASSPCRGSKRPAAGQQTGAALILALLITAIVAVLATQLGEVFQLAMARAENRWHGGQAREYLLATESLAGYFLEQDTQDSETDDLAENWAMPVTMPTDHGYLEVKLEDAQGRFNINALALSWSVPDNNPNPQTYERFSPGQRRFIRLLQSFEEYPLTQQEAINITEAVIDWVDADDEVTGFGGAESLHYTRKEPPYQPANQPFDSVSELHMVEGVTPELYRLLQPLLTVLPEENTSINLNTALPAILRTVNADDDLTPLAVEDVQIILEERNLQPFESVDDFFANPAIAAIVPQGDASGYAVASDYFILHARASVGEQIRYVTSHLSRTGEQVVVIKRRYTSY